MKEQNDNNDSIAWVVHLKTILETHDFVITPGLAIKLDKLFRHYKIKNQADIYRHKGLLIPLIARNAHQQKSLHNIFEEYYRPDIDNLDVHTISKDHQAPVKTIKKVLRWINKHNLVVGISVLLFIVGLALVYVLMNRSDTSANINGKKQQKAVGKENVSNERSCNIVPDFTYRIDKGKKYSLILKNTTEGSGKCMSAFTWSFGDGATKKTKILEDSLIHFYDSSGLFTVELAVWNGDTISAKTSKEIFVGLAIEHDLPDVKPGKTFPRFINASIRIPLLATIAMALVLLVLASLHIADKLYQYFRDKFIRKSLDISASSHSSVDYSFKDQQNVIHKVQSYNKQSVPRQPQLHHHTETIDIPLSIYQTVRSYGFPQLHYVPAEKKQGCLVLIDIGTSTGQQADLFEWACNQVIPEQFTVIRYYYRSSLQFISKEKNGAGRCTAAYLMQQYKDCWLIIWGRGYGLLQPFHSHKTGQVLQESSAADILRNWRRKILYTPVPRNCWSTYERHLLQFIPLQPASWVSIQQGWKMLINNNKYVIPAKSNHFKYDISYPIDTDISACEAFFQDKRMRIWLYALAIPDRLDFNLTLAIGHALETTLFHDSEPLVTYDNLLSLTAVEFIQTGMPSTTHKATLIEALKLLPQGQQAIYISAGAALALYKEVGVAQGTLLAVEKKINELILGQWASSGNKYEIGFLHKHHLLDNFHEKAFRNVIKKLQFSWIKRNVKSIAISSIITISALTFMLSHSFLVNNYFEKRIPKTWIIDKFTRYINEACDSMSKETVQAAAPGEASYKQFNENKTMELLNKAAGINNTSPAYIYNINVAEYKIGKSLYDRGHYKEALQKFTGILERDIGMIDAPDDSVKIFAEVGQMKCYYFLGDIDYFFHAAARLKMESEMFLHDFHINYDSLIFSFRRKY